MFTRRSARIGAVGLLLAIGLVGASCAAPSPGGGIAPINWSFKGNTVKVLNSQDEVCVLICVNSNDEPYLLNINFKVTIGQPGSAHAWLTGSGDNFYNDVGVGQTHTFTGAEQATAVFAGIKPLDLLDALNPSNKMDIVGTYSWAMEEDGVHYDGAAADFAEVVQDALNATVANATLPTDESALVDLVLDLLFNNIGNVLSLVLANLPLFGLGDDTLGGAFYIGLGATGALGNAINAVLGNFSIPSINLLGDNKLPPNVAGGGLYTMTGSKGFTQTFTGADGSHQYTFTAGPA